MNYKSKVLVVDDNERPREVLEALLAPEGYQLLMAHDGATALELAQRELPDLMLLDVMMPGMDGFEVCRRLRQIPSTAQMPVVMITALEDDESRLRGIEAGADDFLTKPVKRQELRSRVRTITRLNRYRHLLEQQAELEYKTNFDPLTGLPNRARLMEELMLETAAARPCAVMMIGLTGLRDVVETLGHDSADQLLLLLSRRLRAAFNASNTLAHTADKEFTLLLRNDPTPELLNRAAQCAQRVLSRAFMVKSQEIYLNGNFGISSFPQDGNAPAILLKYASLALSRATAMGWYAYDFFSNQLSGAALERVTLQADLRRAVQHNDLSLVFQPQIDASCDRMVGVEVLARWQHAEKGAISPARFIPIAEHTGLIREIGQQVLRSACRQLCQWDAQGVPPFHLSVNVSAIELRHPSYLESLMAILNETGVAPARIELELTESALVLEEDNSGTTSLELISALKRLGLKLALDDFGTGYSSLRYLKRFPLDRLKIDQSFVRQLPDDPNDSALTRAIIALARSFNLEVIAEGVETLAQRDFLQREGCNLIQGYFYSRPLTATALVAYVRELQRRTEQS